MSRPSGVSVGCSSSASTLASWLLNGDRASPSGDGVPTKKVWIGSPTYKKKIKNRDMLVKIDKYKLYIKTSMLGKFPAIHTAGREINFPSSRKVPLPQ